ncbi:MAG: hypothetical protein HRU15_16150, partial [Planctomycetes bacterium]|nr:hypothetical protein [Planctomycetota bacterium]
MLRTHLLIVLYLCTCHIHAADLDTCIKNIFKSEMCAFNFLEKYSDAQKQIKHDYYTNFEIAMETKTPVNNLQLLQVHGKKVTYDGKELTFKKYQNR